MRKFVIVLLSLMLFSLSLFAQEKEITDVILIRSISEDMSKAYGAVSTLRCDFSQERTVSLLDESIKSSGSLFFSAVKDSLVINTADGTSILTAANNKAFGEIVKMMKQNKAQGSFIDESNFIVSFSDNSGTLTVNLIPKNTRLKRLLRDIKLSCDAKDFSLRRIDITDANLDITSIKLSNVTVE